MPATIEELLQGKPGPVTARPDDSLESVLTRMFAHDYSQLPVVDESQKPVAMITHESIVRALDSFRITMHGVRVSDAMDRRWESCRPDDELLEVLDKLQRVPAVLVLDQQKLTGILTSHDTTEYFRRRTQDIMLAQDIELMLKDFVQAAFYTKDDALDEAALLAAIEQVSPSNKDLQGPFKKAVLRYLSESGQSETKLDGELAERLFKDLLYRKDVPKSVDRLTLWHHIELLLHESRWDVYKSVFSIDRDAIARLLNSVREARNHLAHLREISDRQHDELKFCKEWLARHVEPIGKLFASTRIVNGAEPAAKVDAQPPRAAEEVVLPLDEERSDDSRLQPLARWLQSLPRTHNRAPLSFSQMEKIIDDKLPASAREHRSWWSNSAFSHPHSKQWLDAGWRVVNVRLDEETVMFIRNEEREQAYIEFFGLLLADLHRSGAFPAKLPTPGGQSWLTVAPMPGSGPRVAFLNFSFAHSRRFRVELYIDTADGPKNKKILEGLKARRQAIESSVGESLSWERLDSRRASRVALYYTGSIEDSDEELAKLRAKAVDAMKRLQTAMSEHLPAVLGDISPQPAASDPTG